MENLLQIGQRAKCIKDIIVGTDAFKLFSKDGIYHCEIPGYLTDNKGIKHHLKSCDDEYFNEHFVLIKTALERPLNIFEKKFQLLENCIKAGNISLTDALFILDLNSIEFKPSYFFKGHTL